MDHSNKSVGGNYFILEEIRMLRANTAPPGFQDTIDENKEPIDEKDEYLRDPKYYEFYYSQNPLDHRLSKPLYKPPIEINHLKLQTHEVDFKYVLDIENQINYIRKLEPSNKLDVIEINNKLQRIKLVQQNPGSNSKRNSQVNVNLPRNSKDTQERRSSFQKKSFEENNIEDTKINKAFKNSVMSKPLEPVFTQPFVQNPVQNTQQFPAVDFNQQNQWIAPNFMQQYNQYFPYQQPIQSLQPNFMIEQSNFFIQILIIQLIIARTNTLAIQFNNFQKMQINNNNKNYLINLNLNQFSFVKMFMATTLFKDSSSKPEIVKQTIDAIKNNFSDISISTYGCRVIQKALETLKDNSYFQESLLIELKKNILRFIMDHNANHVIQKCLEIIEPQKVEFILKSVIEEADQLIVDPYGCRVIQKVIEVYPQSKYQPIIEKILQKTINLCYCQFGNYIVQHLILKGSNDVKNQIIDQVKKCFVELSNNKYASNVMEKVIISCSQSHREIITDYIIDESEKSGIFQMIANPYGNYVVQRLLEHNTPKYKIKICKLVTSNSQQFNEFKNQPYGKILKQPNMYQAIQRTFWQKNN